MRFVVPTSRSSAPLCSMISGMRKPSPISINSPRETITSPSRANAASVTSTAAAQLFTTIAASAPVSRVNNSAVCTSRFPRAPASRSYSRFEYCVALRRNSSTTLSGSGARPRFVCKITPVAFITGWSELARIRSTSAEMRSSRALRSQVIGEISLRMEDAICPVMRARRSSRTVRAISTTRLRSTRCASAASRGCASNSSTEGICRSSSPCSAEIARLVRAGMPTFQHSAARPAILTLFAVQNTKQRNPASSRIAFEAPFHPAC